MAGHNEILCHAAGQRRQNYLNQIKCLLEKMDDTPCERDPGATAGQDPTAKPLMEYPGYVNRLNAKFDEPFFAPRAAKVAAGPKVPPAGRNQAKSMQLLGGYVISGCECLKRNGLQDRCPRSECTNNPQCLEEPYPTCPPAMAYRMPEPEPNMDEMIAKAVAQAPKAKFQYCCCSPDCSTRPTKPDAPLTHSKADMPENFECYPCSQHK